MKLLNSQSKNYLLQDELESVTYGMKKSNESLDSIWENIVKKLETESELKNFEYNSFTVNWLVNNYSPIFASPNQRKSDKKCQPHTTQRHNKKYLERDIQVQSSLWSTKHIINLLLNMASGHSDGLLKVLVDTSMVDEHGNGAGIFETNSKTLILWMWLNGNTKPFQIDTSLKNYLKDIKTNLVTENRKDILKVINTIIETDSKYFDVEFFKRNDLSDFVETIKNFRVSIWFRKFPSNTHVMSLYRTLASVGTQQSPLHLIQSRFQSEFLRDLFYDSNIDYYEKLVEETDSSLSPMFIQKDLNQNAYFYTTSKSIHSSNQYTPYDFYFITLLPLYFTKIDEKGKIYFDYKSYYNQEETTKYHLLFSPDGDRTLKYIDSVFDSIIKLRNNLEEYTSFIKEWHQLIFDLNSVQRSWTKFRTEWTTLGNQANGKLAKKLKETYPEFEPTQVTNIQKLYNLGHDSSSPIWVIILNIYRFIKNQPKIMFNKHEDLIIKYYLQHYVSSFIDFIHNINNNEYLFDRYKTSWKDSFDLTNSKQLPSILEVLYDIKGGGVSVGTDYVCYLHEMLFKNIIKDLISKEERIKNIATNDKVRAVCYRKFEELGIEYRNGETLWITSYGPLRVTVSQTDNSFAQIGHLEKDSEGGDVLFDENVDRLRFYLERRDGNTIFEKLDEKDYHMIWKKDMAIQNKNVNESLSNCFKKYPGKFPIFEGKYKNDFKLPTDDMSEDERLYWIYREFRLYQENLSKFVNESLIDIEYDWEIDNPDEFNYIIKEEFETV